MKGIIGERRENEWEISVRVTDHERHLTLGSEQGIVEGNKGKGEKISGKYQKGRQNMEDS